MDVQAHGAGKELAEISGARLRRFIKPFMVRPGRKVSLPRDFDPGSTSGFTRRDAGGAAELLQQGVTLLSDYQARLAADATAGVLVVLQAMDAAGKDGTIKHVMSGVNPQGVSVHSFKVPSAKELAHDYLWRYVAKVPARGEIAIFNRSYYEETLVVRVHPELLERQRLPVTNHDGRDAKGIWLRRFEEINNFERYLSSNGIRVVKIFLNVSRDVQRQRFLKRIEEREKNWKFTAADVREREFWDDYQRAFADVLTHTSTPSSPWYVIPADNKWFARIGAAAVIGNVLLDIDPQYPEVSQEAQASLRDARRKLLAEPGMRHAHRRAS